MTTALQQSKPTSLASLLGPKLTGTTDAKFYLVSRMRIRSPGGAAEYLEIRSQTENSEAWDHRVKVCMDVMDLYRTLYPKLYEASMMPPYSTQREQEFYRLVNRHLFPLCLSEVFGENDREVELNRIIEEHPNFSMPVIPVQGTQQHDWLRGCCGFENYQTVFQLALVLGGHHLAGGRKKVKGVDVDTRLLGAYGWTHFNMACSAIETPLRYLPLAFNMVGYQTGTPWLDAPRGGGFIGYEWTARNIGKLFLARKQAEQINAAVLSLNRWLVEKPEERIAEVLKLWNRMLEIEEKEGFAGVMTAEEVYARR